MFYIHALFIGYLKSRASLNKGLLALNRSSVLVIEARCAAKAKLVIAPPGCEIC
jgi:hypothetical protein